MNYSKECGQKTISNSEEKKVTVIEEIKDPETTKATKEDGEWIDSKGVKYSADKKKLIRTPKDLRGGYKILEGTTFICDEAFCECYKLNYIEIPNSVSLIGFKAFDNCRGLTDIKIPNSVTYIGNWAFRSCTALTSVVIPNSVTSIENGVFGGCGYLTSIKIPDSVISIKDNAFRYCENLASVEIPNSVTAIERKAFLDCEKLTSIFISESSPIYDYVKLTYADILKLKPETKQRCHCKQKKFCFLMAAIFTGLFIIFALQVFFSE